MQQQGYQNIDLNQIEYALNQYNLPTTFDSAVPTVDPKQPENSKNNNNQMNSQQDNSTTF